MSLKKRILCLLLAVVVLLTALFVVSCQEEAPNGDEPQGGPNEDPDKNPDENPNENDPVTALPGNNVGNLAYSAEVPLLFGGENFNPANNKGKVTVINFWGTWCGPCKAELPHFDRVAAEYAETVTVFAVHSFDGLANAPSYVNELYPNSHIVFGQDVSGEMFYSLYGGNGYYPYTIVLDTDGVITYRATGGLSYEELRDLVLAAQQ